MQEGMKRTGGSEREGEEKAKTRRQGRGEAEEEARGGGKGRRKGKNRRTFVSLERTRSEAQRNLREADRILQANAFAGKNALFTRKSASSVENGQKGAPRLLPQRSPSKTTPSAYCLRREACERPCASI
jgi:hypothetical protein